jgi:hypothetical protein
MMLPGRNKAVVLKQLIHVLTTTLYGLSFPGAERLAETNSNGSEKWTGISNTMHEHYRQSDLFGFSRSLKLISGLAMLIVLSEINFRFC